MDDLGDDAFDSDGSLSDQSSDHEWEPCDVPEQSEDLIVSVGLPEQSKDRKDDLLERFEDLTGPMGVHEQPRSVADSLNLFEQPEDFSRQMTTVSVASGDFCRQTTEDFWPKYGNADLKYPAEGEQHNAIQIRHPVGAIPPCDAMVAPMMWPMLPAAAAPFVFGNVCPIDIGASKQHASAPAMTKPRKNRRNFNPNSLISLAEQAQQRRREEQQFKMKGLHGIQMRQKQEQTHVAQAQEIDPKVDGTPKFCPHCGNGILPHFKCCPFCGSSIAATLATHQKPS
jgi:hypothetical protein